MKPAKGLNDIYKCTIIGTCLDIKYRTLPVNRVPQFIIQVKALAMPPFPPNLSIFEKQDVFHLLAANAVTQKSELPNFRDPCVAA